jgi:RNA polymerase sigma-70 factor (ECF subfamily)
MIVDEMDYEQIVALHAGDLYRFAYSLAGTADDASELTQETYCRLLTKGTQVRDRAKVKAWLFTTLYRIFLGWKRHETRFPHLELGEAEFELPPLTPSMVDKADSELVMDAVLELDERYRVPLILFFLQGLAYREIAAMLDVPIGTVMSRLSRGKDLLREKLSLRVSTGANTDNIVPVYRGRHRKLQ